MPYPRLSSQLILFLKISYIPVVYITNMEKAVLLPKFRFPREAGPLSPPSLSDS